MWCPVHIDAAWRIRWIYLCSGCDASLCCHHCSNLLWVVNNCRRQICYRSRQQFLKFWKLVLNEEIVSAYSATATADLASS